MTHPLISTIIAEGRTRDMRQTATRHRLAQLAQCCKPTVIQAAIASAWHRVAASLTRRQAEAVTCCA